MLFSINMDIYSYFMDIDRTLINPNCGCKTNPNSVCYFFSNYFNNKNEDYVLERPEPLYVSIEDEDKQRLDVIAIYKECVEILNCQRAKDKKWHEILNLILNNCDYILKSYADEGKKVSAIKNICENTIFFLRYLSENEEQKAILNILENINKKSLDLSQEIEAKKKIDEKAIEEMKEQCLNIFKLHKETTMKKKISILREMYEKCEEVVRIFYKTEKEEQKRWILSAIQKETYDFLLGIDASPAKKDFFLGKLYQQYVDVLNDYEKLYEEDKKIIIIEAIYFECYQVLIYNDEIDDLVDIGLFEQELSDEYVYVIRSIFRKYLRSEKK